MIPILNVCEDLGNETCSNITSQHEGTTMDVHLAQIAWTQRMKKSAAMKVKSSESLPILTGRGCNFN